MEIKITFNSTKDTCFFCYKYGDDFLYHFPRVNRVINEDRKINVADLWHPPLTLVLV